MTEKVERVNDDLLPKSFSHREGTDGIIWTNTLDKDDVTKWIEEYSANTRTSWIIRATREYAPGKPARYLFIRRYACHFSDIYKIKTERKVKGNKNFHCQAEIKITVKRNTKTINRKCKFARDGFRGFIELRNEHSHPINTPEILSLLKPLNQTREKFEYYFKCGLGIAASVAHHQKILAAQLKEDESIMINSQWNPKSTTVDHWFRQWHSKIREPSFESLETVPPYHIAVSDTLKEFESVPAVVNHSEESRMETAIGDNSEESWMETAVPDSSEELITSAIIIKEENILNTFGPLETIANSSEQLVISATAKQEANSLNSFVEAIQRHANRLCLPNDWAGYGEFITRMEKCKTSTEFYSLFSGISIPKRHDFISKIIIRPSGHLPS